MGLLDAIFPSSDGGGLLDFLKNNAAAAIANQTNGAPGDTANYGPAPGLIPAPQNPPPVITASGLPPIGNAAPIVGNNQSSPLDNARWPYGPVGAPSNAMAQMQPPTPQNPPAAAAPRPAPQAQPQSLPPAIQNAATAPAFGAGSTANPVSGFLHNAATALMNIPRGGAADPAMVAAQQQANTANLTRQMLMNHGYSPQDATALVQPGNSAALGDALKQISTQNQWAQETDKDGNVWNVNKLTGQKTIALASKDDKFSNVAIKNPDGSTTNESFNTKTGEYGPPQAPPPGQPGSIDPSLTGQARLDAIAQANPDYARKVAAAVNGDIPLPTQGQAARSPQANKFVEDVLAVSGSTSASDFATRAATRKDYASGIASRVTKSLNTTIQHAADLDKAIDALHNYSYFPGVTNWLHDEISNNTNPAYQQARSQFESAKEAFVKELDFTLSGGHSSVSGSAELRDKINRADSPMALHAAVQQDLKLLQARLDAHAKAYSEGTKSQRDGQDFIYPENRATFNRLLGTQDTTTGGAVPGVPTARTAPAAAAPPKLMVGQSFTAPNGIVIKKTSEGNQ